MKSKVAVLSITALSLVLSFVTVTAFQNRQDTRSRAAEADATLISQPDNSQSEESGAHAEYGEPAAEPGNFSDAFEVRFENNTFAPGSAIIKLYTPIIFENEGDEEIEILGDNKLSTGVLKHEQKSVAKIYETPGTYTYYLKSNPQIKGKVTVIK